VNLIFHWSLSQAGDKLRRAGAQDKLSGVPPFEAQLALCLRAETCGIDSVLMAIGYTRPDPMMLSVALGLETTTLKFMVACRPGLVSPEAFVRQVNSVSGLTGGRLHLNIVCGHSSSELRYYGDFLDHDQRYRRSDEFLAVCRGLWQDQPAEGDAFQFFNPQAERRPFSGVAAPDRRAPVLYMGGNSRQAIDLTVRHGDCLWRFPDTPAKIEREIAPVLEAGKQVGLLVSLIARPTRAAAHEAAAELIAGCGEQALGIHRDFANRSDSVGFTSIYKRGDDREEPWITDVLWTGAVAYLGAPAIALVGSFDDIAAALMAYKKVGISQFLFMGWPEIDELTLFGHEVLPRLRALELGESATGGPS